MAVLRRVVLPLVLAGGLAGCVVYPDGTVAPVAAAPPVASVGVGVGPAWGRYYRPWGWYYPRPWGGYYPYRHGYYGPRPYDRWRRW